MNLPNKITTFRMVCVVLIIGILAPSFFGANLFPEVFNINGQILTLDYLIAFVLFVVASFSDFLDGHIARKYNLVTTYGKFMDPIADKLLVDSLFIIVASKYPTLVLVAVIMIARDLVVDGVKLIAAGKNKIVAANMWGKAKTVAQMVALAFLLFGNWPFSYFDSEMYLTTGFNVSIILCYIAGILSLMSMIVYIYQNREVFKDSPKED